MKQPLQTFALAALLLPLCTPALADPAQIVGAKASRSGDTWRFDVTLRHGDTGWDDYADGWRILGPKGEVLATRVLAHPHVNEQPFTRSTSGVTLPAGLTEVTVQSSETKGGWGGQTLVLKLPQ